MLLSLTQTTLAIASGCVVGFSLGLVGGGGSILAVPLLVYVVGLDNPHVAIGTSAIAVALNAASNLAMHGRAGNVKWHCAIVFGAAGVAGAFLGSTLGKMMDGTQIAGAVRHSNDGCWRVDAAETSHQGQFFRQVVARKSTEAAGIGPDGWSDLGLLRHRRRLSDCAGTDTGHRDADPECSRFVASLGHRIRADHGGQLCLVRMVDWTVASLFVAGGLTRWIAWRALRKIACQSQGCANDSFCGADLRGRSLHVGSQPQRPNLRSDLYRRS